MAALSAIFYLDKKRIQEKMMNNEVKNKEVT